MLTTIILTIVIILFSVGISGIGIYFAIIKPSINRKKLMNEGLEAIGLIKNSWQTGVYINEQSQIGLELDVNLNGEK